jgi:hypothetical protein
MSTVGGTGIAEQARMHAARMRGFSLQWALPGGSVTLSCGTFPTSATKLPAGDQGNTGRGEIR